MCSPDEVHEKRLPLFVYGTLRQGQPNYALLRGHVLADQPAMVRGMSLYSLQSYPVVVRGPHTVRGELLTITPRVYDRLLANLDQLEGCAPDDRESMFKRVAIAVEMHAQQPITAWMYLSQRAYLNSHQVLIAHGDWVQYRQELIKSTRFGRFLLDDSSRTKGLW